jgi:hypothetical protein
MVLPVPSVYKSFSIQIISECKIKKLLSDHNDNFPKATFTTGIFKKYSLLFL